MTIRISTGPGHSLEPISSSEFDPPRRTIGYIETHPRLDNGEPCKGFLFTDRQARDRETTEDLRPLWTVVRLDPITLTPSIACPRCGAHGHVTDGRWVPATPVAVTV